MLKLYRIDNNKKIPCKFVFDKFPAGETLLRLESDHIGNPNEVRRYEIRLDFQGNGDLIDLALLVDALHQQSRNGILIDLDIPYFPYARQDRVCSEGESFSLKVVANLINSLRFRNVKVLDPHSDVTPALVDKIEIVHPDNIVIEKIIYKYKDYEIVCPDGGAIKRTRRIAKALGKNIVRADKIRDLRSGVIVGSELIDKDIANKDVLVVDDICDGGATFISLGLELQRYTKGEIALYVSHGLFSKGLKSLLGIYDKIYVYNNMSGLEDERLIELNKERE